MAFDGVCRLLSPPPRHACSSATYSEFFRSLGPRFLVEGDWNAKHTTWGARLITPKERTLFSAIRGFHGTYFSTGEPNYWPTDHHRLPDLLELFVARVIAANYIRVEPVFELSSDHSLILSTVGAHVLHRVVPSPTLTTNHTDWDAFRAYITTHIDFHLQIKKRSELDDATHHLTTLLQEAAWHSFPPPRTPPGPVNATPLHIRNLVTDKRRARSRWQRSRNQGDRAIYKRLKRNLQATLRDAWNSTFSNYITSLSPDDTSLWKVTKGFKRPQVSIPPVRTSNGSWAKRDNEKTTAFWEYPRQVFTLLSSFHPHDLVVFDSLDVPCPMSLRITPFTSFYPLLWKFAQIVMVPKPDKPAHDVASYRPISLLPIPSKVFEKFFLKRLGFDVDLSHPIPGYQFGFRPGHSPIQQAHRVVNEIVTSLEERARCTAAFLDVAQAFD